MATSALSKYLAQTSLKTFLRTERHFNWRTVHPKTFELGREEGGGAGR